MLKHKLNCKSSLMAILTHKEFEVLLTIVEIHNRLIETTVFRYVNEPLEIPECDLKGMIYKLNRTQTNGILKKICSLMSYNGSPEVQLLSLTYKERGKPHQYQLNIDAYNKLVKYSKYLKTKITRNNGISFMKTYDEILADLVGRNIRRIDKYNHSKNAA